MSKVTTDVAITEQADRAFVAGDWQVALAGYATLLLEDPADLYAWYRASLTLTRLGERDAGLQSLLQACEALAESGQLLLAVGAAEDASLLDAAAGGRLIERISRLYGAGSERVDRGGRPPPPPQPRSVSLDSSLAADDKAALCSQAVAACTGAEAAWQEQRSKGEGSLPFHPLLCELPPEDFVEFVPLMQSHVYPEGHVVIEQGSEGSSMFIVARGTVEVSREGVHLAYLRSGSFFGEMALLTHSPRAARVTCSGPTLLFELDSDSLQDLAGSSPNLARVLAEHARLRLLRNLMATSPLFRPLDPARREGLIDLFTTRVFKRGETVIATGSESEGLHLVLNGHAEVVREDEHGTIKLADLGPGDLFGEISLIQRRKATASVTATKKAVVLCLPRDAFNAHVSDYPEVLAHVYKVALEREEANKRLEESLNIEIDCDDEILF